MCGIVGFVDFQHKSSEDMLCRMTESLRHRGPDDIGIEVFTTHEARVGIGHTRLAVMDLRTTAHQPMQYHHYVISYNGEVYNFAEIKEFLSAKGHKFKSRSDTEVIIHAFDEWGVDCVNRFIGMFSFLLYDRKAQVLYGFRDRTGVKPFYYYHLDGLFLFGSELKSFHEHPGFDKRINNSALSAYFHLGYIPAPLSIFQNTYKLLPGNYFKLDLSTQNFSQFSYWDPALFYSQPKSSLSFLGAKEELHDLLLSSVEYRMAGDVPVGVFLSGGYDSTLVAALLQKDRTQKIKTFTIGFESGNNEAHAARQTASYLGTDHHELICTEIEAQNIIADLPTLYDEPFADSSAIPTVLLSRFAKRYVTVALSADGGDELFAGYTHYPAWHSYTRKLKKMPFMVRQPLSAIADVIGGGLPLKLAHRSHQLQAVATILRLKNSLQIGTELYKQMHMMPRIYLERLLSNSYAPELGAFGSNFNLTDTNDYPLLVDYLTYLPDDILVKVDRASMSVALEAREPLLDHRLLEWAARLPFNFKLSATGLGKNLLRDVVHDYVPKKMMDRPKTGFSIPFTQWFRGGLNPLLMDILAPHQIKKSGILDPHFVSSRLDEFNQDKCHYKPFIWKLLMFQMWYDKWMS